MSFRERTRHRPPHLRLLEPPPLHAMIGRTPLAAVVCRVGGRRRAPHGKADWRRFPPAPYQPDVGFSPVRLQASAYQRQHSPAHSRDGLTDQPECRGCAQGWRAAFAAAARHGREARGLTGTVPRRVIAHNGHYARPSLQTAAALAQRPFARARLCCPRRHRYYGLSRQSRRLPTTSRVLRLYAGSLPYGRLLAGIETFPALRHRSFARCHRPYAGEPCGCIRPIPSPQALAFAFYRQARRSQHHSWL